MGALTTLKRRANPMICVHEVEGKGLGVFARKRFAKGETIEQAPVIVLPNPQWESLEQTGLGNHYWYWNDTAMAFCLGYGALYNHSADPNARIVRKYDQNVMEFVALRDIEVDEEVTVDYDCLLWFEVVP
jgi:SET domain-containing protein